MMASTTVGVQISTRERLIRWVAGNMARTGERLTFDEAINSLLDIAERQEADRSDPFAPDAYLTHSPGCRCPDCEAWRQEVRGRT